MTETCTLTFEQQHELELQWLDAADRALEFILKEQADESVIKLAPVTIDFVGKIQRKLRTLIDRRELENTRSLLVEFERPLGFIETPLMPGHVRYRQLLTGAHSFRRDVEGNYNIARYHIRNVAMTVFNLWNVSALLDDAIWQTRHIIERVEREREISMSGGNRRPILSMIQTNIERSLAVASQASRLLTFDDLNNGAGVLLKDLSSADDEPYSRYYLEIKSLADYFLLIAQRASVDEMEGTMSRLQVSDTLSKSRRGVECAVCNEAATFACDHCRSTYYCSQMHQREHWVDGNHHSECNRQ